MAVSELKMREVLYAIEDSKEPLKRTEEEDLTLQELCKIVLQGAQGFDALKMSALYYKICTIPEKQKTLSLDTDEQKLLNDAMTSLYDAGKLNIEFYTAGWVALGNKLK